MNDTDKLTFCTDMRSRKVEEIGHNARTQICWYFTDSREQFRMDGDLQVVGADCSDAELNQVCSWVCHFRCCARNRGEKDPCDSQTRTYEFSIATDHVFDTGGFVQARQDLWNSLSSNARAQFEWPQPGEERVEDDSIFQADGPPADAPVMDTFGMVVVSVDAVDYVSYRSMMRIRFEEKHGTWSERQVNT